MPGKQIAHRPETRPKRPQTNKKEERNADFPPEKTYICSPKIQRVLEKGNMKVIVDNKIPFIREAVEQVADEVVYAPGNAFTPELVKDADALIIRTRTRCDRSLLEGSQVRFIATATIGFDHIDTEYCRQAGIQWANAPGCNAPSVAQYLHSALLLLQMKRDKPLAGLTMGIVGVGHVGSIVAEVATDMGLKVMLNDPPREDAEGPGRYRPLSALAEECDLLTFHVPLVHDGKYPTFHLADETFFRMLRRRPVFINTSRGEVADTQALLSALDEGLVSDAVIDVWEHEPDIDRTLLQKAFIGTPHIAGYSADGKANASRMALTALCRFFGIKPDFHIVPPKPLNPVITAATETEAYLQMYDPRRDSDALKAHPEQFEQLRGDYPLRRERQAYLFRHA